jgi:hypothetical protein
MKRYLLTGICGLALAGGAAAGDLNRCRDEQGHVLLTDQTCAQSGMAPDTVVTEAVAPVPVPAAGDGAALVIHRDEQVPLAEPKRSAWADLPHPVPHRAVALDASTLQAARNTMLMEDEMRRQRKVASAR